MKKYIGLLFICLLVALISSCKERNDSSLDSEVKKLYDSLKIQDSIGKSNLLTHLSKNHDFVLQPQPDLVLDVFGPNGRFNKEVFNRGNASNLEFHVTDIDPQGMPQGDQAYITSTILNYPRLHSLVVYGFYIDQQGLQQQFQYSGAIPGGYILASEATGQQAPNIVIMTQDIEGLLLNYTKTKNQGGK